MNQVKLQGKTTQQTSARMTKGGRVMNFKLKCFSEVQTKDGPRDFASYVECVVWGDDFPESLAEGVEVYLEGRINSRSYEDRTGAKKYVTEVVATSAKVVSSPGRPREPGDDDDVNW